MGEGLTPRHGTQAQLLGQIQESLRTPARRCGCPTLAKLEGSDGRKAARSYLSLSLDDATPFQPSSGTCLFLDHETVSRIIGLLCYDGETGPLERRLWPSRPLRHHACKPAQV
jgi:hypothetical protein